MLPWIAFRALRRPRPPTCVAVLLSLGERRLLHFLRFILSAVPSCRWHLASYLNLDYSVLSSCFGNSNSIFSIKLLNHPKYRIPTVELGQPPCIDRSERYTHPPIAKSHLVLVGILLPWPSYLGSVPHPSQGQSLHFLVSNLATLLSCHTRP